MENLKIFEGKAKDVETDTNNWLSENQDIKIIERKFSTDAVATGRACLAIFYTKQTT